jgi:hypothetical protein
LIKLLRHFAAEAGTLDLSPKITEAL